MSEDPLFLESFAPSLKELARLTPAFSSTSIFSSLFEKTVPLTSLFSVSLSHFSALFFTLKEISPLVCDTSKIMGVPLPSCKFRHSHFGTLITGGKDEFRNKISSLRVYLG